MKFFFFLILIVEFFRFVLRVFFGLLALTTAPEDTAELIEDAGKVFQAVDQGYALDLAIIVIGVAGLAIAYGWGNWRLALHRSCSKSKLERLSDEARRVSEDIANTLSQDRQSRDTRRARALESNQMPPFETTVDQRFLSKHMAESSSILRRLEDVGYLSRSEYLSEIGTAGATGFAAEEISKALRTASDRIKSDLRDGFFTIISSPAVSVSRGLKTSHSRKSE
ncbi:hypothetical protein KO516_15985 [Citreicella sp. C3M06]|uniref:hypothetical protein n=1 Tax=Citreicella sp. C3M06 TaxID=2841564 RepID=UPI001C0943CD|nr:hypothetical protein [Citreicella sp. C3M06]MBU2962289.1 hypothetical protein [Citreicella sp. C3M06]